MSARTAGSPNPHLDISESSPNTTWREPTDSATPHLLLWVIQFIALAAPPFRARTAVLACITVGLSVYAHVHAHFTNDIGLSQPFGIAWAYYFSTLEKFLFAGELGPEGDYWHVDKPAREARAYKAFSFQKLRWASGVIFNQRLIRWNRQIKNVPQMQQVGRRRFLLLKVVDCVWYFLVSDLLFQLAIRFFFTSPDGQVGMMNSKHLTLRHSDWRWQFVKCYVFAATPYFMFNMQYAQGAFVFVLLNISKPEDWMPLFGLISAVTTVRDFWGKYWHQTIRKMLTAYTGGFVDLLGIKRGTSMSSYTQLWLAFTLSGIFHALSQLMAPSPTNITFEERTVGIFLFFLWQAAAITVEDFVQWLWKQAGGSFAKRSTFRSIVGYIWVLFSMWYSIPLAGDVFLRRRFGIDSPLPFSVWGTLMEHLPLPSNHV